MARKPDAPGLQVQALGQLHPQHCQRNRDTASRAKHGVEVAVVRIVVIVDVAAETQIVEKELIQQAQALQRRRIGRQTALEPRQQLIDIAQDLLHVEFGIFVLRQTGRRFEQRKVLVALYQRAEIFKGGGCGQTQGHVSL